MVGFGACTNCGTEQGSSQGAVLAQSVLTVLEKGRAKQVLGIPILHDAVNRYTLSENLPF